MGTALDARGIKSAENLVAHVEGDIEDVEGVLKIAKIRLKYFFKIPPNSKEKAERALAHYADMCPAYQTVKDCVDVSWEADMEEL